MRSTTSQQPSKYSTTLYHVVFKSIQVKCAVFGLFVLLLLQPAAPAFAAFDEMSNAQSNETEVAVEKAVSEESIPLEASPADAGAETETPNVVIPDTSSTDDEAVATGSDEASSTLIVQNEAESTTTLQDVGEVLQEQEDASTTPESDVLGAATSTEATTSVPVIEDEVEVPLITPTTTIPVVATSTPIATSTATTSADMILSGDHNSHAFEFDAKECAVVGDGAYYCSSTAKAPDPLNDGVFSAPDSGGDLEIFVRLNGKESQLTENSVDDSAPYYDALSKRIVWHSLINDRYQIVSYDTKTNEQTVMTHEQYNSMEPVAYGNITLWQAWIGNNWEIIMNDGTETKQLTHNAVQDVSPHMRGGYIVWQTQFDTGWQVAVYDQKTDTIEYIASEGGQKIENPRFVLVYDSTNDEGDIQTVGYDFDKKVTFALSNLPAQLPEKLPDPDQTGETRALIQSKQTSKEGDTEVIDLPQIGSGNNGNGTSTTATSTAPAGTLDLSSASTSPAQASVGIPAATSTSDVVIPPLVSTSTNAQNILDIPDLVIPPAVSTTTEEIG